MRGEAGSLWARDSEWDRHGGGGDGAGEAIGVGGEVGGTTLDWGRQEGSLGRSASTGPPSRIAQCPALTSQQAGEGTALRPKGLVSAGVSGPRTRKD